jgi:hypothetical protein
MCSILFSPKARVFSRYLAGLNLSLTGFKNKANPKFLQLRGPQSVVKANNEKSKAKKGQLAAMLFPFRLLSLCAFCG